MKVVVCQTKQDLGCRAVRKGVELILEAIQCNGRGNIILATGASQFEMLEALVAADSIDWSKVTAFHLDEYVGIPSSHPASFRKYLKERFVEKLPQELCQCYYVNGEGDCQQQCRRLGQIIRRCPIDLAFIGIGENGHLAFNDPPADFETAESYLVVNLDEACRRQQLGEGWFRTLQEVPTRAISMSIPQIMKSKAIICSVPDERKAKAVRAALEGEVTEQVPASILQKHENCYVFVDKLSSSLLSQYHGSADDTEL